MTTPSISKPTGFGFIPTTNALDSAQVEMPAGDQPQVGHKPLASAATERIVSASAAIPTTEDDSEVAERSAKRRRLAPPEPKVKLDKEEHKKAAASSSSGAGSGSSIVRYKPTSLQGLPAALKKHIAKFATAQQFAVLRTADKSAPKDDLDMWRGRNDLVEKMLLFVKGDINKLTKAQRAFFEVNEFAESIKTLDLSDIRFNGSTRLPRVLTTFNKLENLTLSRCSLTDPDEAALLGQMSSLQKLVLLNCDISTGAMDQIAKLPLREFILCGDISTMEIFKYIPKMMQLQILKLYCSSVSNGTVEQLAQLPLRELSLDGHMITDWAAEHFVKMTQLQVLHIPHSRVTNTTVEQLATLPLVELNLTNAFIDDAAAPHFARITTLRKLDLTDCLLVTTETVKRLSVLPLTRLELSRTDVDDEAIDIIAQMKSLTYVSLDNTRATTAKVQWLREKCRGRLKVSF